MAAKRVLDQLCVWDRQVNVEKGSILPTSTAASPKL